LVHSAACFEFSSRLIESIAHGLPLHAVIEELRTRSSGNTTYRHRYLDRRRDQQAPGTPPPPPPPPSAPS
jgi:hypothetical protein